MYCGAEWQWTVVCLLRKGRARLEVSHVELASISLSLNTLYSSVILVLNDA